MELIIIIIDIIQLLSVIYCLGHLVIRVVVHCVKRLDQLLVIKNSRLKLWLIFNSLTSKSTFGVFFIVEREQAIKAFLIQTSFRAK